MNKSVLSNPEKVNLEKVLADGRGLRAYQLNAIRALGMISENRTDKRETPYQAYQDFYDSMHEVVGVIEMYPDLQEPVEMYNQVVDCIQDYGIYDDHHLMHYLEKKPLNQC